MQQSGCLTLPSRYAEQHMHDFLPATGWVMLLVNPLADAA
jgi:hypothetical protein